MNAHSQVVTAVLAAALLAVFSPFTSAKTDEATHKEFAQFAGKWDVVSVEVDGKKSEGEISGDKQWVFDATGYTWKSTSGSSEKGEPALNVSKDPREIEFRPQGTTAMKDRYEGIYKFDDDTLTVCIGKVGRAGPKDFTTKSGDGRRLYVLKRAKAE